MVSSGDPCFPGAVAAPRMHAPRQPPNSPPPLCTQEVEATSDSALIPSWAPCTPSRSTSGPCGRLERTWKRGTKVPGTKPSALWTAWARAWARASHSRQPSVTFEQTLEDAVPQGRKMPGEQDVGPQRDPSPWWRLQATDHKLGPSGLKARAAGRPGRLATGLGLEKGQDPGRWPQRLGGH